MTTSVDPVARGFTKFISGATGGFIGGKNDPIARLLGVDIDSIDRRMEDQKPKKPVDHYATERAAEASAEAAALIPRKSMEANRDRVRSRATAGSVALVSEDKDLLASTTGKGKRGTSAADKLKTG